MGTPVECTCSCHQGKCLHFVPCCEGTCYCGKSFVSGLKEHCAGCSAYHEKRPEVEAMWGGIGECPKCHKVFPCGLDRHAVTCTGNTGKGMEIE